MIQLQDLMEVAHEDREYSSGLIAEVVDAYQPVGEHGTHEKGEAYEWQMAELKAKVIKL